MEYKCGVHPYSPAARVVSQNTNCIDQGSPRRAKKFVISLIAFVGLLVYFFVGLIYMSEIYCPRQKSVQVLLNSLTTSNFHASSTDPLKTTKWEATFTIQNHHKNNFRIVICALETALYYKGTLISCAEKLEGPITIRSMKQRMVYLEFRSASCSKSEVEKLSATQKLQKQAIRERKRGHMTLSLQMTMVVKSYIIESTFSSRFSIVDVRSLDGLDVRFVNGTKKGRWVDHDGKLRVNSTLSSHS